MSIERDVTAKFYL